MTKTLLKVKDLSISFLNDGLTNEAKKLIY